MIDNLGRLMYQRNVTSLKVIAISLHFKDSEAMTISIWLLSEIICFCGSLLPSKEWKGGGLKFYGTWSPQTSSERGCGSRSSSSSSFSLVFYVCSNVWTLSWKDSFCWCRFSIIVKSCVMSSGEWGSILLGYDPNIVLLWCNILFCVACESFIETPRWASNVSDTLFR